MKNLTLENLKAMFSAAAEVISAQEKYLCELDATCGDGDHGVAIKGAISAANDAIQASTNLKDAFFDGGMMAMSNSNGSTSSIYGTLLMGVSEGIDASAQELDAPSLAKAFEVGLASMRDIVKGDVGDKTCFDALIPAIQAMAGKSSVEELLNAAAQEADKGAKNTVNLQAKFGRARNLGEKSIGTLDPGAVSNAMIFEAFAKAFK
ncbi:MAG: DAK2 domain-containing protein [Verrucomicrobiaceae bacterium]|nr:DAK2 domain-containing protein [Verrucomicrobiaceae bacterium]